uniref:Z2f protein n=1 Tax=Vibrio cholerae TaxID=666 RepID=O87020_VIBCL|nr:z2f [Vibrio cholerae]
MCATLFLVFRCIWWIVRPSHQTSWFVTSIALHHHQQTLCLACPVGLAQPRYPYSAPKSRKLT